MAQKLVNNLNSSEDLYSQSVVSHVKAYTWIIVSGSQTLQSLFIYICTITFDLLHILQYGKLSPNRTDNQNCKLNFDKFEVKC